MTATQTTGAQATAELEAIASAAADVVRADAAQDESARRAAEARMAEAGATAFAARAPFESIAAAEREGRARAREELSVEVARRIKRAAQRRRETEQEYEEAVRLGGRIGMAHGEIAAAAGISPNGVRSVLARGEGAPAPETTAGTEPATVESAPGE